MGLVLDKKGQEKLDFLNKALSTSRSSSSKATYMTWIRYFETGKGKNGKHQTKAMLSYWFLHFVFPIGPEDWLNSSFSLWQFF